MRSTGDVAVIIPARDEAATVAATVEAASGLPGVDLVVVVDDGSVDGTGAAGQAAGAEVIRHDGNRGKGAAMSTGAEAVALIESRGGRTETPRMLLFLDADLGTTAKEAGPLVDPVRAGAADMTIARFPENRQRIAGHGFVVTLARSGIHRITGFQAAQPLNGQRCLTRSAFEAARPLAGGFGVETGLTIDLLLAGYVVTEVEVPLEHRPTGADWRGQLHRGRQFRDVALALIAREANVEVLTRRLRRRRERRGRAAR